MSSLKTLAKLMLVLPLVLALNQCVGRKAKPVKVPKKDPQTTTPDLGDQGDDGSGFQQPIDPDSDGDGIPDSLDSDPSNPNVGGTQDPNVNTPTPTPEPTPGPGPGPQTPAPPGPQASEDVTVTLSDGSTKTIKWNGKEHLDTTGKFKITKQ